MKLLLPVCFVLIGTPIFSQTVSNQFELSGKIEGQDTGLIKLGFRSAEGTMITDSCRLKNGTFYFTGKLDIPARAYLSGDIKVRDDSDPNQTSFYMDPSSMKIDLTYNHFKQAKLTGSKTQTEANDLSAKISAITDTGKVFTEKRQYLIQEFIRFHPESFLSVFYLFVHKNIWPFDSVRKYYYTIDPRLLASFEGTILTKFIRKVADNSPGQPAKPFVTRDYKGNPIDLANYKGKYILIDFWASWCVPCREVNPHLVEIYSKYNKKGLEIISVSVDRDKNAWLKAIEKDKIGMWHHILSKMDDNELINELYGISYYPTKILVDTGGKIIARFSGTEEEELLDKKLAEIF